jgi:hypothetical protein
LAYYKFGLLKGKRHAANSSLFYFISNWRQLIIIGAQNIALAPIKAETYRLASPSIHYNITALLWRTAVSLTNVLLAGFRYFAINIRNEGLRLWSQYGLGFSPIRVTGLVLGTRGSAVLGFPQVERLPCASAHRGDVRPKSSGRKKSTQAEAILNELGILH